jgi:hypothetical protein
MADILRIKRRSAAGASGPPSSLANAEICFNERDNVLYYGSGGTSTLAATILPIAGSGSFLALLANIAALRANVSLTTPIWVRGYATDADGGEGVFEYKPTDTTSSDNTATIVVDAANRRWYRATSGNSFNIKWWGAKGDGATDDTAAIQNGLNSGHALYFPEGTYLVSAALTADNFVIRGAGRGVTTIKATATFPLDNFLLSKANSFTLYSTVSELTLDGNKRAGCCLWIPQGQGFLADHVVFMNAHRQGPSGTGYNVQVGDPVSKTGCVENHFRACTFWNHYAVYSGTNDPAMPSYNLVTFCTDSVFDDCLFINASVGNVLDDVGYNRYRNCHTYGYGPSGVTGYTPPVGFILSGPGVTLLDCGVDNAQTMGINIANYCTSVIGGYIQQADPAFPNMRGVAINYQIAWVVLNTIQFYGGITAANAITSDGAPHVTFVKLACGYATGPP